MSKGKTTQRGKLEYQGSSANLDALQVEALRVLNLPNRLDARLLESLLRREESLEPAGPLAGNERAGGWL